MKRLAFAALLLGPLAATPALAQATYQWSGNQRIFTNGTMNGCNIGLGQVTHSGSLALGNIMLTFGNRGSHAVRIEADVEISGNNSRKSGRIGPSLIAAGGTAVVQAFPPGGSTLSGTTVTVRLTRCDRA